MARFVKLVVLAVFVAGLLVGASYAGARARAGIFLGPKHPDLGPRTITFAYRGASGMRGKPRAWVFRYGPTSIPGQREIRIYVSPTGKLLGTNPANLDALLEPYRTDDP